MLCSRPMLRACLLATMLLAAGHASAGSVRMVTAEDWARPRHGAGLVEHPALSDLMEDYLRNPERRILIRYPGGEDGVLWAEELRGWLVALGVASTGIELLAGARRTDALELTLVSGGNP